MFSVRRADFFSRATMRFTFKGLNILWPVFIFSVCFFHCIIFYRVLLFSPLTVDMFWTLLLITVIILIDY